MYQVSIFNNNVETVVHYPSGDQNDPHVNKLPLKDGLSTVNSLSFTLYPNNKGYNNAFELITKVKVMDIRDNTIRFTGRILNIDEKMDNDGQIYKDITCEGALSYLNDTKQRGSSFYGDDAASFINQILGVHNSKVELERQIRLGNINIPGSIFHTCNFKSTLAEILETKDKFGGNIYIREINNLLYLDWLINNDSNALQVSLGVNMKDMIVSKDLTSIGTRIVPLGANNLTIESVNDGVDYIDDSISKNIYGVIEKTVEFKDIDDPTVLKNTCISNLSDHTQGSYTLKTNALDLSFITGNKPDQFVLGRKLNIVNPYMGVDDVYGIVDLDLDLLEPYNPTITIANRPVTLTNSIADLRKSSIQNNGVYNNVQIGSAFGIRAVRSDNKVITTINATDGISIENDAKKVFSVDINGNIITNDITANDMTANRGTFNDITANRGTFTDIYAKGGEFNKITATDGISIEDDDSSCKINAEGVKLVKGDFVSKMQVGVNAKGDGTAIAFDDDVDVAKIITASAVIVKEDELYVNGLWIQDYIIGIIDSYNFATRTWVTNNFVHKTT